jgi:hypothetical protein
VLGAPVFFWIKSSVKAGLYNTAMSVLAQGWPMFLAAIVQKIGAMIRGPRKVENLSLEFAPKANRESQSQNASTESTVPAGQTARR